MRSSPSAVPVLVKASTQTVSEVFVTLAIEGLDAAPPTIESAKSLVTKSPVPPVVV